MLDVKSRNSETHVIVDVVRTRGCSAWLSAGAFEDSIELFSSAANLFRQAARTVHHESPDRIVLNDSRIRALQKGRDVEKKSHFSDSDEIGIEQCDTTDQVGLTKVIGEVELRADGGRRNQVKRRLTLAFNERGRLPMFVRMVSLSRRRCSDADQ